MTRLNRPRPFAKPRRAQGDNKPAYRRDYAAFLVDLDGTLIGKDEAISPRVAEAVSRLSEYLPVSIVSGREPSDVIAFATQLGLWSPQVSDNGALILQMPGGGHLWSGPMARKTARRVVTAVDDLGMAFIATHSGGTATDTAAITDWGLTRVTALDLVEATADSLVGRFNSSRDLHVEKGLLPYNGMWAVNFTRAGVDKGSAARRLAHILGVSTGRLIAAGDSYNDLALLEACGLRIAMGDAPEDLKAMAHFVAPPVDSDGLAVAIEEFVLPRL